MTMPPKIWASSPFSHKHAGDWGDGALGIGSDTGAYSGTPYIRADRVEKLVEAHRENARILGFLLNELQGIAPAGKMAALMKCQDRCDVALTEWEAEQ